MKRVEAPGDHELAARLASVKSSSLRRTSQSLLFTCLLPSRVQQRSECMRTRSSDCSNNSA
eukprot:11183580-Lingulodinium_polyedra.AAC.1